MIADRHSMRAWLISEKRMVEVLAIDYKTNLITCRWTDKRYHGTTTYKVAIEEVFLMQCTGVKDKKNKLIYEGDVLCNGDRIYQVEWHGNKKYLFAYTVNPFRQYDLWELNSPEIIGDIYRNSELPEQNESS